MDPAGGSEGKQADEEDAVQVSKGRRKGSRAAKASEDKDASASKRRSKRARSDDEQGGLEADTPESSSN